MDLLFCDDGGGDDDDDDDVSSGFFVKAQCWLMAPQTIHLLLLLSKIRFRIR